MNAPKPVVNRVWINRTPLATTVGEKLVGDGTEFGIPENGSAVVIDLNRASHMCAARAHEAKMERLRAEAAA